MDSFSQKKQSFLFLHFSALLITLPINNKGAWYDETMVSRAEAKPHLLWGRMNIFFEEELFISQALKCDKMAYTVVHAFPLRVKEVGAALLPLQEPLKPKLVLPPGASVPL